MSPPVRGLSTALLLLALTAGTARAEGSDGRWWRSAPAPWQPEERTLFVLPHPDGVMALTRTRRFIWDGGRWQVDLDWRALPPIVNTIATIPGSDVVWYSAADATHRRIGGRAEADSMSLSAAALHFVSGEEGWAGVGRGELHAWDGRTWRKSPDVPLTAGAGRAICGVGVDGEGHLWVRPSRGRMVRRVGGRWETAGPPLQDICGPSSSMCLLPDGSLVSVGRTTLVLGPTVEVSEVASRSCVSTPEATWVGREDGGVWRWDEGGRTLVESQFEQPVVSIAFSAEGDGFAVADGRLLRLGDRARVSFEVRAAGSQAAGSGRTRLALLEDFDGSAGLDLLVFDDGARAKLLLNRGGWAFHDASGWLPAGVGSGRVESAVACDLDRDGDLDLLLRYGGESGAALQVRYLRNAGSRFVDESERGGFAGTRGEHVPAPALAGDLDCIDWDSDGDLDVFATRFEGLDHLPGTNSIYLNDGVGRLARRPLAARGAGAGGDWVACATFADLVGDDGVDLYLGTFWGRGPVLLTRPAGHFIERPHAATGRLFGMVVDAVPGDLDGDGDTDLLVLDSRFPSRILSREPEGLRVAPVPPLPPTLGGGLADFDGDGRLDVVTSAPTLRLGGDGWGTEDVTEAAGLAGLDLRGVAIGDLDGDGNPDLYAYGDGPNLLLENLTAGSPRPAPTRRDAPSTLHRLRVRSAWLGRTHAWGLLVVATGLIGIVVWSRRRPCTWWARAVTPGAWIATHAAVTTTALAEATSGWIWAGASSSVLLAGASAWIDRWRTEFATARRAGPFRLLEKIGEGATAEVWLARRRGQRRRVAVKVLKAQVASERAQMKRFERSALLAARIDHPGVARVIEWHVGVSADDEGAWMAMEWVPGQPLDERLAEEPLSEGDAIPLLVALCRAVAALHAAGLVHRDLKPANVIVGPGGAPTLVDLGLLNGFGATRISQTGALVGTPAYLAPEQFIGRGEVDARSDVWSLGVLAYEVLTGRLPHEIPEPGARRSESAMLAQVLNATADGRLVPIADISPGLHPALVAAIDGALAWEPVDRWPDAGALADAIELAG